VFNILEDHFTVVLANPEEVKNRKGHKTDRKDAKHVADLLRHDHIRPSCISRNRRPYRAKRYIG
jgi:transposase